MNNQPSSYLEAYNELHLLAKQLENNEVEIDELADLVKRANELINFCQEKLRRTEETLSQNEE